MDAPRQRSARARARGRAGTRVAGALTFLTRALAVFLVLVAYAFLGSVPHPPSTALGIAYGASGLCLAIAAWRLWWPTYEE